MLSETLLQLLRNPECPDYAIRDKVLEETGVVANVYVVCGSTGEYSDRHDWTVAAFLDQSHAEAFCKSLNDWLKSKDLIMGAYLLGPRYELDADGEPDYSSPIKCPLDPEFACDYTGTQYDIDVIPLRAEG